MSETNFIDQLAIRDVGSVDVAFVEAYRMVNDTKEAQPMFQKLLERLEAARRALRYSDPVEFGDTHVRFVDAMEKYVMLLSTYVKLRLAARVVQHIRLLHQLRKIHDILDGVFRGMDEEDVGFHWRRALNLEDWPAQTEAFKAIIADPSKLAEEIRDPFDFQESVMILKFAEESRDPNQWTTITQDLFDAVKRMEIPPEVHDNIPVWFVPPTEVVYHATKVVVKILFEGGRLEGNVLKKFIEEADLWAKFTHPYTTRLFGACHVTIPPFFICEDATNGNLADYLALNPDVYNTRVYRLLFHASLGLNYLHSKDVVHADLKLTNILVGSDVYARIADFGLSHTKKTNSDMKGEETKTSSGALRWRAPECFKGQSDFRSDVYSFGMCIYEAFAGHYPYHNLNDEAATQRILDGELPPQPARMPTEIWNLVLEMTKMNPDERIKLLDVIARLRVPAEEEEKKERDAIVLCSKCDNKMPKGSNYCDRCGVEVQTKAAEDEKIRINSPEDISRVIGLLIIGVRKQKLSAAEALTDYVFGEPMHQDLVHKAGALPILVQLLVETTDVEIRVAAVLAIGCICAVNEPIQNTAVYEHAIPQLDRDVRGDGERQRAKAAMAFGLLADANQDVRSRISEETIELIKGMEGETSDLLKRAAKKALEFLEPLEEDTETPADRA